jgi:hypothetical protein
MIPSSASVALGLIMSGKLKRGGGPDRLSAPQPVCDHARDRGWLGDDLPRSFLLRT